MTSCGIASIYTYIYIRNFIICQGLLIPQSFNTLNKD